MRYVIAMGFAIAGAAVAAWLFGNKLSGWFSRQFTYSSPDGQANVEQMAFLAVLLTGILVGWFIGWAVGSPFARRRRR